MNIFNHKKVVVVGLFSSEADVTQTVNDLQEHNYYDREDAEVLVIDQSYLDPSSAEFSLVEIAGTPDSRMGRPGNSTVTNPLGLTEPEDGLLENDIKEILTNMGVDSAEAEYFTSQVIRGNSLLVVKIDEEHAEEIVNLIEKTNARGFKF